MALCLRATRGAVASAGVPRRQACVLVRRAQIAPTRRSLVVRAEDKEPGTYSGSSVQGSVDVDKLVKDLQEKWDAVDNKTTVAVYGGASIVVLWLASTIVSAVNTLPLLPKLLEVVGLGYTAWFVYRYLLFKSSREELLDDIEELKKRIAGSD